MKSEMDGKIEKYRATSSNKENLLKMEIKTWKVIFTKHFSNEQKVKNLLLALKMVSSQSDILCPRICTCLLE